MLKKVGSALVVVAIIIGMLVYPSLVGEFWSVAIDKYWYVLIAIIFIASYTASKKSKKTEK